MPDDILHDPALRAFLKEIAREGAREVLHEIGLSDEDAGRDIRNLRDLLRAYNDVIKTGRRTLVQAFIKGFLGLLLIGAAVKFGFVIGSGK